MSNIIDLNSDSIIQQTNLHSIVNKKILITGAAGLIGLHLVNTIARLNQNNSITCVTNSPIDSQFKIFFNNTDLIISDLTTLVDNPAFKDKYGGYFDIIIHAAGYGQESAAVR